MKRVLLSLCILCMAGVASAQLSIEQKALKTSAPQKMPVQFNKQRTPKFDSLYAFKSCKRVFSEPAYVWDGNSMMSWFSNGISPEDYKYEEIGWGYLDEVDWILGTGLTTYMGSGEIGYRFYAGNNSYYSIMSIGARRGYPYGAVAYIWRAPSTDPSMQEGVDDYGNTLYKKMPLYFKLYNNSKITLQEVCKCFTDPLYPLGEEYVEVHYPADPEDCTGKSEVIETPMPPLVNDWYPGDIEFMAEFETDVKNQQLGDYFCVSIVFPVECEDHENAGVKWWGPTTQTWKYNAMLVPTYDAAGNVLTSAEEHCTYFVIDWQQQVWESAVEGGQEPARTRPFGYVKDSMMQPNGRYSVVPMDAFYWRNDHSSVKDEPFIGVFYTERAALESANHADRYVEVSPNPATDYVNFKSFGKMHKIEIISLNGKTMKVVDGLNVDKYNLNVSNLNSGMYVARITGEKGVSTKKLIVK